MQFLLEANHFRLELTNLRIQRVAHRRLCAALVRGQPLKRTLSARLSPCRQVGAIQSLPAKQPSHLARLGAALGLAGFDGSYDPRVVSRELAGARQAFAGIELDSVGRDGRVLAAAEDA